MSLCLRLPDAQYTLILPASKNLPSQTVDFLKGRTFHRKSVGVRVSSEPVCQVCTACVMAACLQFSPVYVLTCSSPESRTQAVLEGLGRPLLCTSVHVPEHLADDTEVPDLGSMLEQYGGKGIDFIIDVGPRVATVSTVGWVSKSQHRDWHCSCAVGSFHPVLAVNCCRWWT